MVVTESISQGNIEFQDYILLIMFRFSNAESDCRPNACKPSDLSGGLRLHQGDLGWNLKPNANDTIGDVAHVCV